MTQLCRAYIVSYLGVVFFFLCGPGFSLGVHSVLFWFARQYECALGRVGGCGV